MGAPLTPANGHEEILIAGDSPTQAEQLKQVLEERGHAVTVAANGKQAFEAARTRKPSLIVSDIVMPEMDGYALCKRLKTEKDLKDVPVILMTSLSSPEDVVKGLECGADIFIRKPYDKAAFLSRIDYALSNRTLRKRAKMDVSLQIQLGGKIHHITSEPLQILDLLISTYEDAIRINAELSEKQTELARLAAGLESQVEERTAALRAEIAERQMATEQLRQSEEMFRLIAENINDLIAVLDLEGKRLYNSPSYKDILGDPTALLGSDSFNEIHPDDRQKIRKIFQETVRTARGRRAEYRFLLKDGSIRFIESQGSVIPDAEGKTAKVVVVSRDVTERNRTEEALAESEARFRSLVENAAVGIYRTTPDGRIVMANPTLVKMLGYDSFQELASRNPGDDAFEPHYSRKEFLERVEREGEIGGLEWAWTRRDGSVIFFRESARVVRSDEGRVLYHDGIVEDVTARKKLEEQFLQAQKMEAVGQLAGGVAHDFNNLLTVINGYSEIMLGQLKADDPNQKCVGEIKKAGDRAAALTRQLLAFSRRQFLMPQVLDLNQVVADVHTMLKRMIGEDIDLVTIPGQNLGRVKADSGQIVQVLLNLAVNARDAMPQGGKLTIETANVELDESYVRNHVTMKSGSYVMLAVSDSGTGMDAETQKRMFEPFFTTKGQGKGTGLGLSTVYGIVKQSGGYIWAYSEPGHGTTFKAYLPQVNEQPVEIVGPKKANVEELCGTETILIVEDDAAVCTLVHSTLELYGYQVLEATNGAEALLVSEQYQRKIHLLLTDLVMPGISGRVLAERMAISHAGMKVIYMSGYTDDTVVRHGVLAATTAYLQKPFTPVALSRKVREVLDDNGDPPYAS